MATKPKAPAARGTAPKPAAPPRAVESEAEGARTYRVLGRMLRNGDTLRPANPANGRPADTVQLTDREAYGLAGFVELLDTDTPDNNGSATP